MDADTKSWMAQYMDGSVAPEAPVSELPSNVEAEASLLGAMMLGDVGWLIERGSDKLDASSFHYPLHGRIFDAIQREHSLGKQPTPVLLRSYFENDPEIKELGGIGYLARLTGDTMALVAPAQYCDLIAELARRRKIMAAMRDAYERCCNLTVDVPEIVSDVDAAIDEQHTASVVESDAAECMASALAELDAEHVGVMNHRMQELDELLGALEPKSLTYLAARPGMGKTAVATNYALGAAREGHGVCFISLEMSREQLAGRMIADVGFDNPDRRVAYSAIQRRTLNAWERERVNEIAKWIGNLPLSVVDAGSLTIGRVDRIVRSQKRRMAALGRKLELVVIDYLGLLNPDQAGRSRYEDVGKVSRRLKGIAKDHGVAILCLAQLNRAVETRPDHRPILADLRDSGDIEQDADAVLFLLREEYYLRQSEPQNDPEAHDVWEAKLDRHRGRIDFILAKRRNGTIGTAQGRFYGPYQAVR